MGIPEGVISMAQKRRETGRKNFLLLEGGETFWKDSIGGVSIKLRVKGGAL